MRRKAQPSLEKSDATRHAHAAAPSGALVVRGSPRPHLTMRVSVAIAPPPAGSGLRPRTPANHGRARPAAAGESSDGHCGCPDRRREMRLEGVDIIERKLGAADPLDTAHHFDQPAARGKAFFAQEQRLAPRLQHRLFRDEDAVAHERDLARSGTASRRICEPCQPARRAFGPSGFRASMMSAVKKCFGTTKQVGDAHAAPWS